MKPQRTNSAQGSFLRLHLGSQLDLRQALYRLAKATDWKFFERVGWRHQWMYFDSLCVWSWLVICLI
jgi:hypothetical protein